MNAKIPFGVAHVPVLGTQVTRDFAFWRPDQFTLLAFGAVPVFDDLPTVA